MKTEVRYNHPDPVVNDKAAIKDIKSYLAPQGWDVLMQEVGNKQTGIKGLSMLLGFAGIEGYPFHAFCRTYRLADYRQWMLAGGYETDEKGFNSKESDLYKLVKAWLFPDPEVVGSAEWETILEKAGPIVTAAFLKSDLYEPDEGVTEPLTIEQAQANCVAEDWAVHADEASKKTILGLCVFA